MRSARLTVARGKGVFLRITVALTLAEKLLCSVTATPNDASSLWWGSSSPDLPNTEEQSVEWADVSCPAFLVPGSLVVEGNLIINGRVQVLNDADLKTFDRIVRTEPIETSDEFFKAVKGRSEQLSTTSGSAAHTKTARSNLGVVEDNNSTDTSWSGMAMRLGSKLSSSASHLLSGFSREKLSRFAFDRCSRNITRIAGDLIIPAADLVIGGGRLTVERQLNAFGGLQIDTAARVRIGASTDNANYRTVKGLTDSVKRLWSRYTGDSVCGQKVKSLTVSRGMVYLKNSAHLRVNGDLQAPLLGLDSASTVLTVCGDIDVSDVALLGSSELKIKEGKLTTQHISVGEKSTADIMGSVSVQATAQIGKLGSLNAGSMDSKVVLLSQLASLTLSGTSLGATSGTKSAPSSSAPAKQTRSKGLRDQASKGPSKGPSKAPQPTTLTVEEGLLALERSRVEVTGNAHLGSALFQSGSLLKVTGGELHIVSDALFDKQSQLKMIKTTTSPLKEAEMQDHLNIKLLDSDSPTWNDANLLVGGNLMVTNSSKASFSGLSLIKRDLVVSSRSALSASVLLRIGCSLSVLEGSKVSLVSLVRAQVQSCEDPDVPFVHGSFSYIDISETLLLDRKSATRALDPDTPKDEDRVLGSHQTHEERTRLSSATSPSPNEDTSAAAAASPRRRERHEAIRTEKTDRFNDTTPGMFQIRPHVGILEASTLNVNSIEPSPLRPANSPPSRYSDQPFDQHEAISFSPPRLSFLLRSGSELQVENTLVPFDLLSIESGSSLELEGATIDRLNVADGSSAKVRDGSVEWLDALALSNVTLRNVVFGSGVRLQTGSNLTAKNYAFDEHFDHFLATAKSVANLHTSPSVDHLSSSKDRNDARLSRGSDDAAGTAARAPSVLFHGQVISQDSSHVTIRSNIHPMSQCSFIAESSGVIDLPQLQSQPDQVEFRRTNSAEIRAPVALRTKLFAVAVPPHDAASLLAFTKGLPIQIAPPGINDLWTLHRSREAELHELAERSVPSET